jgi:hypothetical protein
MQVLIRRPLPKGVTYRSEDGASVPLAACQTDLSLTRATRRRLVPRTQAPDKEHTPGNTLTSAGRRWWATGQWQRGSAAKGPPSIGTLPLVSDSDVQREWLTLAVPLNILVPASRVPGSTAPRKWVTHDVAAYYLRPSTLLYLRIWASPREAIPRDSGTVLSTSLRVLVLRAGSVVAGWLVSVPPSASPVMQTTACGALFRLFPHLQWTAIINVLLSPSHQHTRTHTMFYAHGAICILPRSRRGTTRPMGIERLIGFWCCASTAGRTNIHNSTHTTDRDPLAIT